MPIILDDITLTSDLAGTAAEAPITPKYFHADLTGRGMASGRLNRTIHPANPNLDHQHLGVVHAPEVIRHRDEQLRLLPVSSVLETTLYSAIDTAHEVSVEIRRSQATTSLPYLYQLTVPETDTMFDMSGNLTTPLPGYRLWASLVPQVITLRKDKNVTDDGEAVNVNTTHVRYRVELYAFADAEHNKVLTDEHGVPLADDQGVTLTGPALDKIGAIVDPVAQEPRLFPGVNSFCWVTWTYHPEKQLADMLGTLGTYLGSPSQSPLDFDRDAFFHWSDNYYGLYDRVCDQAVALSGTGCAKVTNDLLSQVYAYREWEATQATSPGAEPKLQSAHFRDIAYQLRFLEHYDVPLSAYAQIYHKIAGLSDQGISQALIKQNMQLSLNSNLNNLDSLRDQLSIPDDALAQAAGFTLDPKYSLQQREAITTCDPLVIVQAGAGTGKSTVILERLNYLIAAGVDPTQICVLSFTNAAADNITAKNDRVVSMTISKMIHETYVANFPSHEISSMDTIVNSLDIYYGDQIHSSTFLSVLRRLIHEATRPGNVAMTQLSAFIERYTTEVLEVLTTIGQTSLELEIIICYLLINELVEPFVSPKHLIIDEVQDNSVFEFVYALRYAAKHLTSLYLVGDSSQTLYEFRASNPKALNALESSGVFSTHRLTTNYRSNQEILDFANIHLTDIEANKYAGIQLMANSFEPSTATSFQEKVKLDMHHVKNQGEFVEHIPNYLMSPGVREFVDGAIARNEQTTVLAGTRVEVLSAKKTLEAMYPHLTVANLTSERSFNSTTFSLFIRRHWDEVTAVAPGDASFVFTRQVQAHLPTLEKNHAKVMPIIQASLSKWWLSNNQDIMAWVAQADNNLIPKEEFFLRLRDNILQYEMRNNMIRQSLTNQRNNERKTETASTRPLLLVSTIHGAKGLEFDNTIVLSKPQSNPDEAAKRMAYVALTRARSAEYIISGSSRAYPRLKVDYDSVVTVLTERDKTIAEMEHRLEIKEAAGRYIQYLQEIQANSASTVPVDAESLETVLLGATSTPNFITLDEATVADSSDLSVDAPWCHTDLVAVNGTVPTPGTTSAGPVEELLVTTGGDQSVAPAAEMVSSEHIPVLQDEAMAPEYAPESADEDWQSEIDPDGVYRTASPEHEPTPVGAGPSGLAALRDHFNQK